VLTQRREAVVLGKSFDGWTPITVHLTGEISPRDRKVPYRGAMFAGYPGDVVFSKIDARNGAIGVLPSKISRAVVTAEFPVFAPDASRLDGAFARFVVRTGGFLEALRRKASGTSGRKRITPEAFLDLLVPFPSLSEQQAIIAEYRAAIELAASLEDKADGIELGAAQAFEAALGFDSATPLPEKRIFVASFANVERWSHEGMLRASLKAADAKYTFPFESLGSLGRVSYGLQKSPKNRPTSHPRPYLRVANVQRWRLDLSKIKMINVPDELMPKYRLEDGDVLLCEGNSADLVGRGAIWRGEIEDCVHQNHVLRVRVDKDRVTPEFVLAVVNSTYGQSYFRSKAKRTTNLASINSKEVSSFLLPLPSVTEQRDLIDALFAGRDAALSTRAEAQKARAEAWASFESAIYPPSSKASEDTLP
jgi:type I restriction enzyme, S subunit